MKPLRSSSLLLFSLALLGASCSSYHRQAAVIGSVERDAGISPPAQDQPRDDARYGIPPDEPTVEPSTESAAVAYPAARKTSNPDEVESPYPPHHRVNVRGFQRGQFAKDPKSGKIFVVP